jgi:predicted  nucleic acid-binding Zn-ribbon protein
MADLDSLRDELRHIRGLLQNEVRAHKRTHDLLREAKARHKKEIEDLREAFEEIERGEDQ